MKKYILLILCVLLVYFIAAVVVTTEPSPAKAAETLEHEVVQGDDLHLLAGYYYRDPRRWQEIFNSNRDRIKNADLIWTGMVLKIPGKKLNIFPLPYSVWRERIRN